MLPLSHRASPPSRVVLLATGERPAGAPPTPLRPQALQRDGWFFIQDAAVGGGCSPVAQGYRLGAPAAHLLRRHVQCALAADCPTVDSLRAGVVGSFANWWGLPPTEAADEALKLECYDSSVAKLWADEFDAGGEGEEEEERGSGKGAGLRARPWRGCPAHRLTSAAPALCRGKAGRAAAPERAAAAD